MITEWQPRGQVQRDAEHGHTIDRAPFDRLAPVRQLAFPAAFKGQLGAADRTGWHP